MIKVTMNLTDTDAANADFVYGAIDARSKAQAVSFSLAIAQLVLKAMIDVPGTKLYLEWPDGTRERIVWPGQPSEESAGLRQNPAGRGKEHRYESAPAAQSTQPASGDAAKSSPATEAVKVGNH